MNYGSPLSFLASAERCPTGNQKSSEAKNGSADSEVVTIFGGPERNTDTKVQLFDLRLLFSRDWKMYVAQV
jgi:hypothetical protein